MHLHFRVTEQSFGVRKHVLPQMFALIDRILVFMSIILEFDYHEKVSFIINNLLQLRRLPPLLYSCFYYALLMWQF